MAAKISNSDQTAVVEALRKKHEELERRRARIQQVQGKLEEQIRNINSELVHLVVAGRMFGADLPMPAYSSSASSAAHSVKVLGPFYGGGALLPFEEPLKARRVASAAADSPPMPKVKDLVLDRLKAAGDKGAKAAEIRQFIETTYGVELHEKTVGMSLYRFLKQGKARREGIIWFFVPQDAEKKNPGAGTPGPRNLDLD